MFDTIKTNNAREFFSWLKRALTLIQFQKVFQTEDSCHQHLYHMEWTDEFCCPRCLGHRAYEVDASSSALRVCAVLVTRLRSPLTPTSWRRIE
ncbi:transposase [Paenibacillus phocaensis]|uniref:transposase n=1 Tax=Paenibacillus phocaensis TaxID=1776378 RepID=UPI0038CD8765